MNREKNEKFKTKKKKSWGGEVNTKRQIDDNDNIILFHV
jgi:hypothetical protein